MIRTIAAVSGLILMAGCATPPTPPAAPAPDAARVALDKAIEKETSFPPHSVNADSKAVPAKMSNDRITIRSYVGDASNLLSRVAKARGMTFSVTGPEPRLPLFVTVDVDSVSLEGLLTQVGHQFGQRADPVLGDNHIEIRYRGQP